MLHPNEVVLDKDKKTLLLRIHREDVTESLSKYAKEARTYTLQEKKEFHITVIGFRAGKSIQEKLASLDGEDRNYKEAELRELIGETDWNVSMNEKEGFFIEKEYFDKRYPDKIDIRRSIIQRVAIHSLELFYSQLNTLLETNLEAPPVHITLFVGGTDVKNSLMGIGIETEEEFIKLEPIRL